MLGNRACGWLSSLCFCSQLCNVNVVGVLLSRETMELRPWSVCGGAAAPTVAVETDPRAADIYL